MNKSHLTYIRRIIGRAIAEENHTALIESILSIKTPSSGIYQVIRDIVCDARFYSVIDNDNFWKSYGTYKIKQFIDSLTPNEIDAEEALTMLKEDFLNEWMASHMMPLSSARRMEIEAEIRINMLHDAGVGLPDPDENDGLSLGVINLGEGIKDSTNRTGEPAKGLPTLLKDYMDDAKGGTSPGLHNDGHQADVRFLDSIDPEIVRLAEMIGRHYGDTEPLRGRFRPAPKSDISGISVSSDLNSLLPIETALLASPESEKIFLDRYVRKKLQTFSSVSASPGEREKKGPIYLCIDTSGSMTGEPEEFAKTLALAIAIIAQREKRHLLIVNYSDSISFFVLRNLVVQRKKLMGFLSDSYGGGNDENKLFRFLFERLPNTKGYVDFSIDMRGADLLVISDFLWDRIESVTATRIDTARSNGLRIFSVGIDQEEKGFSLFEKEPILLEESRTVGGYRSGQHFYLKSDFRYRYRIGRLNQDLR
ncbi:MAG: hypothetical protein K2N48_01015 [Muribaculaceae bacterium]|nr:hypothetical protein [Muribaculaceae bacterium]